MKNNKKKFQSSVFKVLKCVTIFYMTFYNLQNSVKLPPKYFQRLQISKFSWGSMPRPYPLDVS